MQNKPKSNESDDVYFVNIMLISLLVQKKQMKKVSCSNLVSSNKPLPCQMAPGKPLWKEGEHLTMKV